jgi:hypothetical protein
MMSYDKNIEFFFVLRELFMNIKLKHCNISLNTYFDIKFLKQLSMNT